jgi:hypothetical protein
MARIFHAKRCIFEYFQQILIELRKTHHFLKKFKIFLIAFLFDGQEEQANMDGSLVGRRQDILLPSSSLINRLSGKKSGVHPLFPFDRVRDGTKKEQLFFPDVSSFTEKKEDMLMLSDFSS